jgi:hypothetical protein
VEHFGCARGRQQQSGRAQARSRGLAVGVGSEAVLGCLEVAVKHLGCAGQTAGATIGRTAGALPRACGRRPQQGSSCRA